MQIQPLLSRSITQHTSAIDSINRTNGMFLKLAFKLKDRSLLAKPLALTRGGYKSDIMILNICSASMVHNTQPKKIHTKKKKPQNCVGVFLLLSSLFKRVEPNKKEK